VHWRDYFRQRFFGLEPRWDKAEILDNAAQAGVSHAVIIREIQRAIDSDKLDPISWAASVVARMAAAGVKTLADADEYERKRQEEKSRRAKARAEPETEEGLRRAGARAGQGRRAGTPGQRPEPDPYDALSL